MARQTREQSEERWAPAPRNRGGNAQWEEDRPRRGPLTPTRIIAVIAVVGALAYVGYAILFVRDTSGIPMLASGAVVLGIVFLALAVAGGRGTLIAGREGRNRGAFVRAIGGGIAAMIGFGCFAAAIILVLTLGA